MKRSPDHRSERLIIFTRYPCPGKTKTRIIPALGEQGAADLQHNMTLHILRVAEHALRPGRTLEIRYEGGDASRVRQWLGNQVRHLNRQPKGDLGKRLKVSFGEAFAEGACSVVAIGADCPDITADVLDQAFGALLHDELVVGPATDGGYYLIGMNRLRPELFADISWGTAMVLEETLKKAEKIGSTLTLLKTLDDIDRPEDLTKIAAKLL